MTDTKPKRSLIRNTFALIYGNSISAILSFVYFVILGRILQPSPLGSYVTALAWIYPLTLLTEFGLSTLTVRDLSADLLQTRQYVRINISLRLWIGVPCIAFILFLASTVTDNPNLQRALIGFAPLIIILPLFSTYSAVFRAHEQMLLIGILNFAMLATQVGFALLANAESNAFEYFVQLNTLTSLGQLLVAMGIYYRYIAPTYPNEPIKFHPFTLLKQAFPFAIGGILAVIQLRLGLILLERTTLPAVAGAFAVATRFIDIARIIPMSNFDALYPRLASQKNSLQSTPRIFFVSSFWLIVYGTIATLLIGVFSSTIIETFFGERYKQSELLLGILAYGIVPIILKGLFNTYAYAMGHEKVANAVALIGILLLVGGYWILNAPLSPSPEKLAVAIIVADSCQATLLGFYLLLFAKQRKSKKLN